MFWNRPDWQRCALRAEIEAVYARAAPGLVAASPMRPGCSGSPDAWREWDSEIGSAAGFARPEVRSYAWDWQYTSEQYARLLRTHSDHIMLDPCQQEALYEGVRGAIDAAGGVLALTYVTWLCLASAV